MFTINTVKATHKLNEMVTNYMKEKNTNHIYAIIQYSKLLDIYVNRHNIINEARYEADKAIQRTRNELRNGELS